MGEVGALPALTVSLLLLLSGCGSAVVSAEPPSDPYDGPLFVEVTHPHSATDPVGRYGAAADVVRCDSRMTGGFSGDGYDDGAAGAAGWGWHVESWARCDLAEFEPAFAASLGVQVWSDGQGARTPTRLVRSYPGSAHCHWEEMTFLKMRKALYARDPSGEVDDFADGRFEDGLALPEGLRRRARPAA
jgi:hypothetical protein